MAEPQGGEGAPAPGPARGREARGREPAPAARPRLRDRRACWRSRSWSGSSIVATCGGGGGASGEAHIDQVERLDQRRPGRTTAPGTPPPPTGRRQPRRRGQEGRLRAAAEPPRRGARPRAARDHRSTTTPTRRPPATTSSRLPAGRRRLQRDADGDRLRPLAGARPDADPVLARPARGATSSQLKGLYDTMYAGHLLFPNSQHALRGRGDHLDQPARLQDLQRRRRPSTRSAPSARRPGARSAARSLGAPAPGRPRSARRLSPSASGRSVGGEEAARLAPAAEPRVGGRVADELRGVAGLLAVGEAALELLQRGRPGPARRRGSAAGRARRRGRSARETTFFIGESRRWESAVPLRK